MVIQGNQRAPVNEGEALPYQIVPNNTFGMKKNFFKS